MRLSKRTVRAVMQTCILIIFLQLFSGLIENRDHDGYAVDVFSEANLDQTRGSKAYVAVVFRYIQMISDFKIVVGILFYSLLLLFLNRIQHINGNEKLFLLCILPLVILPINGLMITISKEALIVCILSLGLLLAHVRKSIGFAAILLGIAVFAIYIRPYYGPAFGLAMVVALLGWKRTFRILYLALIPIAIFAESIAERVNTSRKRIWLQEVFVDRARSKIELNFDGGSEIATMVQNYITSSAQIYFPIIFYELSVKEMFLQILTVAVFVLSTIAAKRGEKFLTTFSITVLLTLPLFVGTIGTWSRHAGIISLVLFTAIIWSFISHSDQKKYMLS